MISKMKVKIYSDKTVAVNNWCNAELQEALNHLKIAAGKIEGEQTLYIKLGIQPIKEKLKAN